MLSVLFAAAVSTAALSAPPADIKPAHVSLAWVLKNYRRGAHLPNAGSERWHITFGQLKGTSTDVWDDGFERSDMTLGPFHTAAGTDQKSSWHMNENGEVVSESGLHQGDAIDAHAIATGASPAGGLTLLGQVQSPRAYVVKVDPHGGRLEYLFIDPSTFRLVRREEIRAGKRISIDYRDPKTFDGVSVATHLHVEDGKPQNVREEVLESASFAKPAPAALARPTPGPPIVSLAQPTASLPAKIIDDRVILPFHLGGHIVDMQLDSGAAGIVIDRQVVRALGYRQYGRVTGSTAGDYTESDVVIPEMSSGGLTLRHFHATSAPFFSMADARTPVAGLIGFDLLDQLVMHIDYQDGTVEAIAPASFTPPSGAVALPIALDDDIPVIAANLDAVSHLRFGVDTGADRSLLFQSFITDHPTVLDEGLGDLIESASPFVDKFSGVGGTVSSRPLQAGPFVVGPWSFDRWLFYVTQDAPTFAIDDYAGLIGQDVLRYYDVYFDYPRATIYLLPNKRYRERWG